MYTHTHLVHTSLASTILTVMHSNTVLIALLLCCDYWRSSHYLFYSVYETLEIIDYYAQGILRDVILVSLMAGAISIDTVYNTYRTIAATVAKNILVLQFRTDMQATQWKELVSTISMLYYMILQSSVCISAVSVTVIHNGFQQLYQRSCPTVFSPTVNGFVRNGY
jgi:hypothetical protein